MERKLPKGWNRKLVSDISHTVQYGLNGKMKEDGEYVVLRMGNLQNGKVDYSKLKYIDLEKTDAEKYLLKDGDILFNRTNSFELVGKTSIFEEENNKKVLFASYLIRVQVNRLIVLPEFINYFLNANHTQTALKKMATRAVSQANINAKKLQSIEIPLPPLPEQKRIVAKLDALFERIDKAIALLEENVRKMEEMMEAVLNHVFENAFENWEVHKLEEFDKISAGGTPSRKEKKYWENGTIPWFISRELNTHTVDFAKEKITDEGLKNSSAKLFSKGTLLVGMYDTAAMKMSILEIDAACNQAIVGINPDPDILNVEFLKFQLEFLRPKVLEQRQGVRQKNLNATKIRNIEIGLPSKTIQESVVFFIKNFIEKQIRLKETQSRKLQSLHALKSSLLDKSFRGEI